MNFKADRGWGRWVSCAKWVKTTSMVAVAVALAVPWGAKSADEPIRAPSPPPKNTLDPKSAFELLRAESGAEGLEAWNPMLTLTHSGWTQEVGTARDIAPYLAGADFRTRQHAIQALSGCKDASYGSIFIAMLDDGSGFVQYAALMALAANGEPHDAIALEVWLKQWLPHASKEGKMLPQWIERIEREATQISEQLRDDKPTATTLPASGGAS